jgi:class 3 adenylate cyclase/TolB-like protein
MSEEEIDRKITIIFATDVVGYSKHMEADESETVKNLRACEKLLTGLFKKYKGRLFNTGGDSFFAEFSSAVSAVECAVEFQKAIEERNLTEEATVKLEFRIGINSGDVIKEKDNLLGDGVNIAARLEALAQSGGITISKSVYDYVKGKTKFEFNDLGIQKVKQNEFHAFDILLSESHRRKLENAKQKKTSVYAASIAAVLIALVGASYFFLMGNDTKSVEQLIAESDRANVLVMPFENRSGNNSDDYLSNGMTDIIISSLANYPRLSVQSSSTSNFIRDKGYSDSEILDNYLVNYILRGSNQVSGDKIRTTVELSDIIKKKIIWTEKYDFVLDDIFEVQDSISSSILNKLQIKLTLGESFDDTRKYFKYPENWQRYLKANALWLTMSPEQVKEAGTLFETIFDTEPDNPVVLSMYAWYFTAEASAGLRDWNIGNDMVETAKKAVKFGPELSDAYSLLATLMPKNPDQFNEYSEEELKEKAQEYAIKSSDLNPKNIISILSSANALFTLGLHEKALKNYEKALRVAPHPPGNVKLNYSLALMYVGNYEKSLKLANELSENEQYFGGSQLGGLGILTFIAMQENRRNDAKKLANKILEIDSNMTFDKLKRHMKTFIIMDKAFMKKIKESLIESGIPA